MVGLIRSVVSEVLARIMAALGSSKCATHSLPPAVCVCWVVPTPIVCRADMGLCVYEVVVSSAIVLVFIVYTVCCC